MDNEKYLEEARKMIKEVMELDEGEINEKENN